MSSLVKEQEPGSAREDVECFVFLQVDVEGWAETDVRCVWI